jgi:hypothetical protein
VTSFRRACVCGLTAGVGALALGMAATPAPAASFTLNLSAPATAVVGQPFVIQASGTDPTDQGALYLEIDSIATSVATSCPTGYLDAAQLATSTGGGLVAFDQRENLDAAGSFSVPVGYTPKAAGQWLFCGYTDDGATDTLATSSVAVNIQAPGSAPPGPGSPPASGSPPAAVAKPADTTRPRVSRSGSRLRCRPGAWSNDPSSYAYRWLVNGRARAGAHSATLAVTRGLRGHRVQCSVRAANAAGAATAVSAALKIR